MDKIILFDPVPVMYGFQRNGSNVSYYGYTPVSSGGVRCDSDAEKKNLYEFCLEYDPDESVYDLICVRVIFDEDTEHFTKVGSSLMARFYVKDNKVQVIEPNVLKKQISKSGFSHYALVRFMSEAYSRATDSMCANHLLEMFYHLESRDKKRCICKYANLLPANEFAGGPRRRFLLYCQ